MISAVSKKKKKTKKKERKKQQTGAERLKNETFGTKSSTDEEVKSSKSRTRHTLHPLILGELAEVCAQRKRGTVGDV